jgi:hypothetical protein
MTTGPITVDLPHNLGAEEAKRRMQANIGRLKDQIPGGAAVQSGWSGDRMNLGVKAMGQDVRATLDVEDKLIRVQLDLPPVLSFFRNQIEGMLKKQGGAMLEDKSGNKT